MRNASLRRIGAGCLGSLGLLAVACGDPESSELDDGEGGSSASETVAATTGSSAPVTTGDPSGPTTSVGTAASSTGSGAGGDPAACEGDESLVTGEAFAPTAGPEGGLIDHVAATANVVVASTGQSLHRSTDGGATWSLVDVEPLRNTQIQSVVARGNELFVGTWDSVIRSRDDGETWEDVSGEDGVAPGYMSVRGEDLYATWLGKPLRWDADEEEWIALPVSDHSFFDTIECDGEFIYGNAIYEPGVFRISLAEAFAPPEPGDPDEPIDPDVQGPWAKVEGLSEWGYRAFAFRDGVGFAANSEHVFESHDDGTTWSIVDLDEAVSITDFLVVGDALYAATDDTLLVRDGDGDWASTEMGWFSSSNCLATDGSHVFAAARGLRRASSPAGPWEAMPLRADGVWSMVEAGGALLVSTETGTYRSADRGASWSSVSPPEGQYIGTMHGISRGDEVLLLGARAVLATDDGGQSFDVRPLDSIVGDGWANLFTEVDGDLVIGVTRGVGGSCAEEQSATTELYRSSDGGLTWTEPFGALPDTFTDCYGRSSPPMIDSFARAGGALLAASSWQGLFRSVDDGASWAQVELDETLANVRQLTAVGDVVVGALGYDGGLARSVDDGATWQPAGLEGHVVLDLVASGGTLFAATSNPIDEPSIQYSVDGGLTWTAVDAGFHTEATSLAIVGDQLFAGTVHASVWSAPLSCAPQR